MKSLRICFIGLVALVLLVGCAEAITQPTAITPQDTNTTVFTVTAQGPISTSTRTITPIPPPTRRPTSKGLITLTPEATIPPVASFTIAPTSRLTRTPSATITGTNTLFVRGPFSARTWTATPVPYACLLISSFPKWGTVFKPRTDFVATWKIYNSGANMWHVDDIVFGYVGGDKMHNKEINEKILPYTIYKGSFYTLHMHMVPPKEPGTYTEIWGLRKTNKKEFFCTFEVTIVVAK